MQIGNPKVVREMIWTCSNIAGDSTEMAIKLVQNEIFDMITLHLENCDIFIRKEAVYTISNILTTLDPKDTLKLL